MLRLMRTWMLVVALLFGAQAAGAADVVDTAIGQGISTTVTDVFGPGSGVSIATSITSVTYGSPAKITRQGITFYELQGSVQGIGWGGGLDSMGGPGPTTHAEAHYAYDVPFVLRLPAGFDGTLLYYQHGYASLGFSAVLDFFLGADNDARRFDLLESGYVAWPALQGNRRHAVFAANLGGLRRDGSFAATITEGPHTGTPVNMGVDVPISRDLAVLARRLVAHVGGVEVERAIGIGHSGGALIMQYLAGGLTDPVFPGDHGFAPIATGGNFVEAYEPDSGLVFDGVIPIAGARPVLHPAFPATARMIQITGTADYANVEAVQYVHRLLLAGVDVNAMMRVYQIANAPHNFREIVESTPATNAFLGPDAFKADGDAIGPVVASAVDHMREWLVSNTAPPVSRIDGVAADTALPPGVDTILFSQAAGGTTSTDPTVYDETIDVFTGDTRQLTAAAGFPGTVNRYAQVLAALLHEPAPLLLPSVACRQGGYVIGADARLEPFTPSPWANEGQYRACVAAAINALAKQRLYAK
jgi:hypothetical protein